MKTIQLRFALNALALASMLVFAAQAADAASPSISPDMPTVQNAADTSPEMAEVNDFDTEVSEVDVQDVETPDVGEIESVSEVEGPESH